MSDKDVAVQAVVAEKEFHDAVAELHRVGEEDSGEWTNEYENMVVQRDGMLELVRLATIAIGKGDAAIEAHLAAINANTSAFARPLKRREVSRRLVPEVDRIRSDMRTFQMLTPAISNNWYKDPTGRHDERYRGEVDWTDRVRSNGIESKDDF